MSYYSFQDIRTIRLIVSFFPLMIPISIYGIGKKIGFGVAYLLFKIQGTYFGFSFITIAMDISYVVNRIITGRSALSSILWVLGTFFVLFSILLFRIDVTAKRGLYRAASVGILISALLLFASLVTQYGLFLQGDAGYSIPIGIPVMLGISCIIFYKESAILKKILEKVGFSLV